MCRAGEELRTWTVAFLIRPPFGEELLKSIDKATRALASGDGQAGKSARLDYEKARRFLEQYVRALRELETAGVVMPSIAAVLLRDASALIAEVDALIAGV